jgi:hypothetical protein
LKGSESKFDPYTNTSWRVPYHHGLGPQGQCLFTIGQSLQFPRLWRVTMPRPAAASHQDDDLYVTLLRRIYICIISYFRGRTATLHRSPFSAYPTHCLPASVVNFRDPAMMFQDSRAYTFVPILLGSPLSPRLTAAVSKLWHTLSGLYM